VTFSSILQDLDHWYPLTLFSESLCKRIRHRFAALIADMPLAVSTRLLGDCCAVSTIADYLSRRWKISSIEY
jgi:hypothetical protein